MFKLGTKSVLAGGTAALLAVGGAASAFILLDLGARGEDEATTYNLSASNGEVELELLDKRDVATVDLFTDTDGVILDVIGKNRSELPVTVAPDSELEPTLSWNTDDCPAGSFVVETGSGDSNGESIPPGTTFAQEFEVGSFVLQFVSDPDVNQNGCLGEEITFTWEGAPTASPSPSSSTITTVSTPTDTTTTDTTTTDD